MMKKTAILGAGTMGTGIAGCYAIHGEEVSLYSRTRQTLDRAMQTIAGFLDFFAGEGLICPADIPAILARIHPTTSLEQALEGAWYVQETIRESPQDKQELYQRLDAMLPQEVILSSNTSYLNIFDLLPQRRQIRACIVHWVAPAHIMPLVEIVRGPQTDEAVMEEMLRFHTRCGKTPVRIDKYIPGFIINRLQSAMNREVLGLIQGGYCTPETIDLAVKASIMPRGMLLGVVQRMDFNGVDNVANGLKNQSFVPFGPPEADNPVSRLAAQGDWGVKSGMGFYDYSQCPGQRALAKRDAQLLESVRLAERLGKDPIGQPR